MSVPTSSGQVTHNATITLGGSSSDAEFIPPKLYHPAAPQPRLFLNQAILTKTRSRTDGPKYRIPLGCVRTKQVHDRFPVRLSDGHEGISVTAFTSVTKYTKVVPPRRTGSGWRGHEHGRQVPGRNIDLVPEGVYATIPAVRTCFPKTIIKLAEVRPARKSPETSYTFAHLLTNVANRQWTWCYNMTAAQADWHRRWPYVRQVTMVERTNRDFDIAGLLRDALFIVAICSGWDEQRKMTVWYPELEFRIPTAWVEE
ncbi:hypothetical protein BN946_scf184491.g2 [Trametes cinnabarina]|uniref:Uncharacterized protein n=1 Tax=Pycnoporus cinnabarinus TaxID=5643 RepID=A0A060SUP7_PYCCI|nr:hypothetical protein BN946_scf184491.g2 [Trametes cinnabarina]